MCAFICQRRLIFCAAQLRVRPSVPACLRRCTPPCIASSKPKRLPGLSIRKTAPQRCTVCLHVEHDALLCFNGTARRETCCPCILETSCPSVLVSVTCVLVLGGVLLQRCTEDSKERRGFRLHAFWFWVEYRFSGALQTLKNAGALAPACFWVEQRFSRRGFWVSQRFSAAVRALLLSGALAPEVRIHGFSRAKKGH